ncbi:TspO/MBR family protein [compost metagenome]
MFEIAILLAAILATLVRFGRIDRVAGALFVPYLAWVGFATFLNFTLWSLNR